MKAGGLRRLLRNERASEIAEAALVMPLTFLMLLGIYWFGRAFNTYATINHAAREGARALIAQSCANCGNASPTFANVNTVITRAMQASSLDPSQARPIAPSIPGICGGGNFTSNCTSSNPGFNICSNAALTYLADPYPQVCGVTISFQYPYQFWFPFTSLNNQKIWLTAEVHMVGEY